jgi:hypothetical protein
MGTEFSEHKEIFIPSQTHGFDQPDTWRFGYPLVNIQKTMENHHFSWVNQL